MNVFSRKTKVCRTVYEELLFTPRTPTIGYINRNKIYLDALDRDLSVFHLSNYVDPTKWNQLTHIYLPRNKLMTLPDELFDQAKNLVWLDVRWNELKQFPSTIKDHAQIKTLLLQNNDLSRLPIELGSLDNLQCLSVINNPLEFPSKETLSKIRTNEDLIRYMKQCWQKQTDSLSPIPFVEKSRRKKIVRKLAPVRKVKDHTEVICRLRNSTRIKDQLKAERMLQMLEFEHKLIQSFKNEDVLKKWRDRYKESQGSSSKTNGRFLRTYSHSDNKRNPSSQNYFPRDINSAIGDLRKQLSVICTVDGRQQPRDPEQIMREKKKEMENIQEVRKKITQLKNRC